MTTPWQGEVKSWSGFEGYYYYGDILTDGTRVFWHLERIAFYLGTFSDTRHMSGWMFNRQGSFGSWRAVKTTPVGEPVMPGQPGVEFGAWSPG